MAVPEIMFSFFCWKRAVRSLNLLTHVIAQIIAPYNIYSIKFVLRAENDNQEKK